MRLMMKMTICFLMIASIVLLAGCQDSGNEISCNEPYIVSGTSCCLDQDSNMICDENEKTAESQPIAPAADAKNDDATAQANSQAATSDDKPSPATDESPSETEDALENFDIEDPGLVGDYLNTFLGRQTKIIFGQDTSAPLVAATINLLSYYGNPSSMEYTVIPDTTTMDEFPDTHAILLGNGCNNNFIKGLLALDDGNCFGSLDNDTGILKMLKVNGKYVLFIMAKEDTNVHSIVNSLIGGKIETSGNEAEVDLS